MQSKERVSEAVLMGMSAIARNHTLSGSSWQELDVQALLREFLRSRDFLAECMFFSLDLAPRRANEFTIVQEYNDVYSGDYPR